MHCHDFNRRIRIVPEFQAMKCNSPSEIVRRGLDHSSDMDEEEHGKFLVAFKNFKEETMFDSEVNVLKLKYYVQMAFLEGWKAKVDIDKM